MRIITVARKPLSEQTVASNMLVHETGALNIDATRTTGGNQANATGAGAGAGQYDEGAIGRRRNEDNRYGGTLGGRVVPPHPAGRWPANLILYTPLSSLPSHFFKIVSD